MSSSDKTKRCSYKKITEEVRMEIINRILQNGQNLKDVAHDMNVNISTCKAILKVYQEEGRVGKKKRRNKVYNVIETFTFFTIDGSQVQQIGETKIDQSKVSLERDQNFDQFLQQEARIKAQNMLEGVMEERNRVQEATSQYQAQMMQYYLMQNGYLQFLNQGLPISPASQVKVEEMSSLSYGSEGSSSSLNNGEVKQE